MQIVYGGPVQPIKRNICKKCGRKAKTGMGFAKDKRDDKRYMFKFYTCRGCGNKWRMRARRTPR